MKNIENELLEIDDEILTLNEVKSYLRISHSDDDVLIKTMMRASREIAESYLGMSVVNKKFKLSFDPRQEFARITFPEAPIREISRVDVIGENKKTFTLDEGYYFLDSSKRHLRVTSALARIVRKPKKLEIYYECGFKMSEIRASFKVAGLVHIAAMYENRGIAAELPKASKMLYCAYRQVKI